jgi:hypothetical protein
MRKYIAPFLIATTIFWGSILVVWYAKYTVTSGERRDDFAGVSYGYRIEQYYFWNSMRLVIWQKYGINYGMNLVYDLPALTVDKVVEERWLKNNAALYLNLQIKYHDSMPSVDYAKVIYDFHKGEMHTSSGYTLWRIWNEKNKTEDWMSESEFEKTLSQFNR